MKIVLLSWWYKEYCVELANSLSKTEDTYLFLPTEFKAYVEKHSTAAATKEYFDKYRLRDPRNILSIKKLIRKINSLKPDVVHLQDGYPWLSFFLKDIKAPIVTTLHDPKQHLGEEKIWETFRDRMTRKHTIRYIVHGEFLKEQLHDHLKVDKNKIDVIAHGNFNVFKPKRSLKNTRKILFFGRIWPYKGLDYLIKAEPLIEPRDFKIVIAGEGEDFSRYRKMMENRERFVVHNKYISNEDTPRLFEDCDMVVLPYVEASQSGVIPVAYAFRKPVIATRVGSIPEMVDIGKTGLLVPPKDERALADAISSLLKHPEDAQQMGQAGYAKSKKDLSWDAIAKKTIKTYNALDTK